MMMLLYMINDLEILQSLNTWKLNIKEKIRNTMNLRK